MPIPGAYAITGGMPDGADNATLTLRATYGGVSVDRTIFVGKAKTGSQGNPGSTGGVGTPAIVLSVTKPTMMIMAYAEGTPVDPTFTGDDGQLTVMEGVNDVTYACTLSVVAAGCAGSINTAINVPVAAHAMGYYRITAMTADTATLTLNALYKGITFSTVVTLAKAKGGYEIVGSLPVTNLFEGRIVYLTTDGKLYKYHSGAWVPVVNAPDLSGILSDAQINSAGKGPALNDDPLLADPTAWMIEYPAWGPKPLFLTTVNGASGTTMVGSAAGTAGNNMVSARQFPINNKKTYRVSAYVNADAGTNGTLYLRIAYYTAAGVEITAGGTPSGVESILVPAGDGLWHKYAGVSTPPANAVFAGAVILLNYVGTAGRMYAQDFRIEEMVTGDLLVDGAVVASKILARTIDASKISTRTLTANEIGTGVITANEIYGGTITGNKLAAGSIITASAQINDGVIISAKIGNLQVTTAQIADLTVGTNKIGDFQINRMATAVLGNSIVIPSPTNVTNTMLAAAYTPDTNAGIKITWTLYYDAQGGNALDTDYENIIQLVRYQSGVEVILWQGLDTVRNAAGASVPIYRILSGTLLDTVGNTTARTYRIKCACNGAGQGYVDIGTTLFVQEVKK